MLTEAKPSDESQLGPDSDILEHLRIGAWLGPSKRKLDLS